jgi:hypothetical protein
VVALSSVLWNRFRRRPVGCALGLAVLLTAGCGGSSHAVPKPSEVRADLGRHGINLEASAEDAQGCVVMQPRASNSGATETYGEFTVVIARDAKCNDAQAAGDADSDHVHWARSGAGWTAVEQLEDNLWLRMRVPNHDLGDRQHALETASFHAFDTGA